MAAKLPPLGMGGKGSRRHTMGMGVPENITGGGGLARAVGNYHKTPPAYLAPMGGAGADGGVDPTAHPDAMTVRGGSIKRHPKQGDMGPGPMDTTGSNTSYPKDIDQA